MERVMRGAMLRQIGDETLEVRDDLEMMPTGPGMVRIATKATGVCHSDLSAMNGILPFPAPAVLGHEGAGEVVEVGPGVTGLAEGDHVIVSWAPRCGVCHMCVNGMPHLCVTRLERYFAPVLSLEGAPVFSMMGLGTFSDQMLVPASMAVRIDPDIPYDIASLIGCGVTTGVGAAINTARVEPGSSVVVFGLGGVGISVIQGALIAGAAEIVAVDPVESKHELAMRFGATHAVTPEGLEDIKSEVTGGGLGFDYAFEAIGLPQTIRACYDVIRERGTACIVGIGGADQMVQFNAFEIAAGEKRLIGSVYGSADVQREFHRLLRLWKAGRLNLEGMISQKMHLHDVNQAIDDMKAGKVIRTVLEI